MQFRYKELKSIAFEVQFTCLETHLAQEFRDKNFDAKRVPKYWQLGLLGPEPDAQLQARSSAMERWSGWRSDDMLHWHSACEPFGSLWQHGNP